MGKSLALPVIYPRETQRMLNSERSEMSLKNILEKISAEYPLAVLEPLKDHPLAKIIRRDLIKAIKELIGPDSNQYFIKGSPGQGQWSNSPWAAIMNPIITESAECGFYPVFLFSDDFSKVSLIMGQGTYEVRREFGSDGPEILKLRATLLQKRVPEFKNFFSDGPFPIRPSSHAGADWETASAWGKTYQINSLPSDNELGEDLRKMLHTYNLAFQRGGIEMGGDFSIEPIGNSGSEIKSGLEGARQLKLHARIERERNSRLAKDAKRFHGDNCQACHFNFKGFYGDVGAGFIEAHHLKALHTLTETGPILVDPKIDFAVLCSNCHRMIHKMGCPSLEQFRQHLLSIRS